MKRSRSYQDVAEQLRQRIRSAEWSPGQMLPGRRALAKEYNVAIATMERVISILVAENILFSENRRGTFVCDLQNPHIHQELVLPRQHGDMLQATVAVIAKIVPYESLATRERQWPAQILSALENRLSTEPGLTQHFFNLVQGIGKADIDECAAVEQLVGADVDAIVLIGALSPETIALLQNQLTIPLVYVDCDSVDFPVNQVFMDSISGGFQAYTHLKQRGYQSITYLRPFNSKWVENRLRGAQIAGAGEISIVPLNTKREMPLTGSAHIASGYDLGLKMLENEFKSGIGIIAPNDAIAEGFINAASEKGLESGKDYGIIGFDNYKRNLNLSSLSPPLEQLGNEAALILSRILKGEAVPSRSALKPQLIARRSTNNSCIDN